MSYNFNPQPNFVPGVPLQTAAMHAPIPPTINIPMIDTYNFDYHSGAVRINATNSLEGDTASPGTFSKGVLSFWACNITTPGGAFYSDYIASTIQKGSYDLSGAGGPPAPGVGFTQATVGQFYANLQCGNPSLFTIGLIQNPAGDNPYFNIFAWGCPGTIGTDLHGDPLPTSPWHHYIASFDSQAQRIQMACDRGGGPAWGGGVMDTALGMDGFVSIPPIPGTAPQKMWYGTTFAGGGNIANPANSDWTIMAPVLSSVDLAYCYLGVTDTFFDLTTPGNLDYFVSQSITPVDLGTQGRNVPLTCLFMHTGNAVDPFLGPSKFQFPYNAATGRLWGGTISDAPTQPPQGA